MSVQERSSQNISPKKMHVISDQIGFVLTRLNSKKNMNMVVFDDISSTRKIKFKCAVSKHSKCSQFNCVLVIQ